MEALVVYTARPMSQPTRLSAQIGSSERDVTVEALGEDRWKVVIDGVERVVDAVRAPTGAWSLAIDGQMWSIDLDPTKDGDVLCDVRGRTAVVKLLDPRRRLLQQAQLTAARARATSGPLDVRAPMPGKVVKLLVKPGDAVAAHQGLVVVEAMKMENELKAPRDGKVLKIAVSEGQAVEGQEVLVTLE
jgi:acetyl/propionyl-CoA carboxylase alpha subunit